MEVSFVSWKEVDLVYVRISWGRFDYVNKLKFGFLKVFDYYVVYSWEYFYVC